MSAYTAEFAKQTAARLPFIRGGKQGAIAHMEAMLANWKGDTRRDGDTPKEFWETVLKYLKQ
jgi:hypothetical protein